MNWKYINEQTIFKMGLVNRIMDMQNELRIFLIGFFPRVQL